MSTIGSVEGEDQDVDASVLAILCLGQDTNLVDTNSTSNQRATIELALADYQAIFGRPLIEACEIDE